MIHGYDSQLRSTTIPKQKGVFHMKEIESTAIIGMGALGMLYADKILSAAGPQAVAFVAESDLSLIHIFL